MTNSSSGARLRSGQTTERQVLGNGLVVRLTPARDLPYAVLIVALPVGLSREPADRAGLASVTAELMARGHAGKTREQVAEAIDMRGAHFHVRQGRDAMLLELRLLSKDLAWGLELLAGMVRHPNLEEDEFAKVLQEAVGAAQSREEEPRDRALELFGRALMGDHPYGRHVDGTSATLETLRWEQVRRFYELNYGPAGGVVCLVGDVDPKAMALTEQLLGDWAGGSPSPPFEDAPPPAGPVLASGSMPIEQAKLVLGFPSIARNDPDYYALLVMNYIFGGAFRSRLTQNLRAARGLAYSVGSGFSAGKVRGSIRIGIQTGNEQAATAVAEILKEVERIRTYPVSPKELSEAQHALLGGYPLRIDTLPKIAALSMETEIYGLPEDHLEDFRRGVSGLTAPDLTRVARRLFLPEHLAVGMVADLDRAGLDSLETLWPKGPVEDLTVGPTEGVQPSPEECIFSRPDREEPDSARCPGLTSRGERVHEAELPNGLKVLMLESHKAPVATVQVWYRVGSRNESVGLTGMSHFLEHMMFRGSPRFPDGRFDEVLALNGGTNNAFTTEDYTAYYESMAAGSIDFALELESDRMRSLMFTSDAFYRERDVVVEERRLRVEDSPTGTMLEQLNATAFVAHPYRWPVIGWMSDVASFTPEDMVAYYRTYYTPANAILVIAGDVDPERTFRRVWEFFSTIPSGSPIPPVRTREPRQQGERRYEVRKKAGHGALLLGYHAPNLKDPDSYALELLALLLAGGDSARLPTELVFNQQLALSAWTYYDPVVFDSALFMIGAEYTLDTDPQEVENVLLAEVARLGEEPVDETELAKAVNQWEADFVMKQDDVEELAVMVGAFAVCDHWRHLVEDAEKIRAVTPKDIQRVARQYFSSTSRSLGRLIPVNP